jgi:hypothetical protein
VVDAFHLVAPPDPLGQIGETVRAAVRHGHGGAITLTVKQHRHIQQAAGKQVVRPDLAGQRGHVPGVPDEGGIAGAGLRHAGILSRHRE